MSPPSPRGLLDVERFVLPRTILAGAVGTLAEAGQAGHECFVVFGGKLDADGRRLTFTSALRPAQTPHRTPHGLLVTVDGRALFSVNQKLRERGEILAGQIHAHPTDAFHSDTDDHRPLATLLGALSIVVPDFALSGLSSRDRWAWLRLVGPGEWHVVRPQGLVDESG
jgi:hypothetical protein